MSFTNVHGSLDEINREFRNIEERREILIKNTRDMVMLCSKSIIALHNNEMDNACIKISQAKIMLDKFKEYAKTDLQKYIAVAEQEFVEAYVLKSIVEESSLPSKTELNVSGSGYLTGLLDCIGELKRMVYDRMRAGEAEDATKLFAIMQDLYSIVYPFAVYDNLIPGLRRKLDVSKMLIEDIRALITEETRRAIIIKAVNNLQKEFFK
ncbi:MAG TPA: RNA-binding protein [Nitrososphaeraceae archaeon]|jgi:translin|nr:RNA-binding protein [Nitrososphaeraceae archaeon]HYX56911.1 RNA-binding protein [Nitrososphaeraceae archaeon]